MEEQETSLKDMDQTYKEMLYKDITHIENALNGDNITLDRRMELHRYYCELMELYNKPVVYGACKVGGYMYAETENCIKLR